MGPDEERDPDKKVLCKKDLSYEWDRLDPRSGPR